MVAVGDMAVCGSEASAAVSDLLDQVEGEILALGDLVYPNGSIEDFARCFEPVFGRHSDRILPVVGNHEYFTTGAAGYVDYFGDRAGEAGKFWYAEERAGWQVLVLNSNCSFVECGEGSEQYRWLEEQLTASPETCRVVAMHHPRWTSFAGYSDNRSVDPMVRLLEAAGTDLILSGHAHHYERFEQQTADRMLDDDRGFHHFIVGTGGVALRPTTFVAPHSASREQSHGVLELSLGVGEWAWTFHSTGGDVLDEGTDTCVHGDAVGDQEPELEPEPEPAPEPKEEVAPEPLAPPIDPQLHRLYLAVFLRTPDNSGLEYWLQRRQAGASLHDIAGFFTESPEFSGLYGEVDDNGFIDLLYRNVLDRQADGSGRSYWQARLAGGTSRGEMVLLFSDSAEFIARTGVS